MRTAKGIQVLQSSHGGDSSEKLREEKKSAHKQTGNRKTVFCFLFIFIFLEFWNNLFLFSLFVCLRLKEMHNNGATALVRLSPSQKFGLLNRRRFRVLSFFLVKGFCFYQNDLDSPLGICFLLPCY